MRADEIFLAAVEKPTPAERAAYLDGACGDDAGLREQVQGLIKSHEQAGSFLEGPLFALPGTSDQIALTESPGTVIGPYRLLQIIGEGGMGTVYMAEQTQPVRRTVALKLIKAGMDSRQVLARFSAERQALALMDHPNIAKVFDAGTTHSGRPYFVMELVKGIPITRFCDERRLTTRERLELAIPVCQAVQHAHQKGIIHRDLKPSNVLIALYDGKPVPKVIDFGVAKATGPRLTDQTLYTEFGAVVGTLEYMSPEQAELNQLDIDTRSDIYSLGVLLYELLTGSTPLDRKRLKQGAILEMLRVVREEESPRPSRRLSTTDELPSIAACRNIEPRKLSGLVRGELDWIVMRALEKDRNRRYETANGLAADLRRYLDDEPVQACPPSAGYRLRKQVRRHKVAISTALLVAAALVVGTVISTWQAIRTTRAVAAARDEADKANAINEFLAKDLLYQASPYANPEADRLTVREALDRAAERVESKFRTRPLIEAALRFTIGATYTSLGVYDKGQLHSAAALEIYQREKGPGAVETANAMAELGSVLRRKGESSRAEPLLRQATDCLRRALSEGHPDTLHAKNLLANMWRDLGKIAAAETLLSESMELSQRLLGPEDPHTIVAITDLAHCYRIQGKLSQAEPLAVKALELSRRALGENDSLTIWSLETMTHVYEAQGKLSEAQRTATELLAKHRRAVGEEHRETLRVMSYLAKLYVEGGKLREAEQAYREVLALVERRVAKAPEQPGSQNNLAWWLATCPLENLRDPQRSVELAKKAVELAPKQGMFWNTLGVARYRAGEWKAAIDALTKSMELLPGQSESFNSFFLAMAHWQLGDKPEGRSWYDKAVAWMEKNQPKDEELIRFRAEAAVLLEVNAKKK
jgi:eukaryotic-like serine/threonine-protein kinase